VLYWVLKGGMSELCFPSKPRKAFDFVHSLALPDESVVSMRVKSHNYTLIISSVIIELFYANSSFLRPSLIKTEATKARSILAEEGESPTAELARKLGHQMIHKKSKEMRAKRQEVTDKTFEEVELMVCQEGLPKVKTFQVNRLIVADKAALKGMGKTTDEGAQLFLSTKYKVDSFDQLGQEDLPEADGDEVVTIFHIFRKNLIDDQRFHLLKRTAESFCYRILKDICAMPQTEQEQLVSYRNSLKAFQDWIRTAKGTGYYVKLVKDDGEKFIGLHETQATFLPYELDEREFVGSSGGFRPVPLKFDYSNVDQLLQSYEIYLPLLETHRSSKKLLSLWSLFKEMADLVRLSASEIVSDKLSLAKEKGLKLMRAVKEVYDTKSVTPYVLSLCFNTHLFLRRCFELETDMSGIGCLQLLEKGNDRVKETVKKKTSQFATVRPPKSLDVSSALLVQPSTTSSNSLQSSSSRPSSPPRSAQCHPHCPNGYHVDPNNTFHPCEEYCYQQYGLDKRHQPQTPLSSPLDPLFLLRKIIVARS